MLPAGVTNIAGTFRRGDTVEIIGPNGHWLGRGLAQYDSDDASSIVGLKSSEISEQLGPSARSALIHRDNLVLEA